VATQGYNTLVGEVGIKFSGGQRQRLAIARAIVRRPAILIFDEATSALDVTSERIVQAALDKVSQNRTTIIIAHRLSTVMGADKIIVLSKGKVVQEGTHGQLLAEERGPYWRLVNAQSLVLDIEEEEREENEDIGIAEDEKPRASVLLEKNSHDTIDSDIADLEEGKAKLLKLIAQNFFGSFGMLLAEQKRNWVGYMVMLIAAIGAACEYLNLVSLSESALTCPHS
jgi:ATP-binding cassette subfamily B (MDR/TAP) protein 1